MFYYQIQKLFGSNAIKLTMLDKSKRTLPKKGGNTKSENNEKKNEKKQQQKN
jgi:hypothetical protein